MAQLGYPSFISCKQEPPTSAIFVCKEIFRRRRRRWTGGADAVPPTRFRRWKWQGFFCQRQVYFYFFGSKFFRRQHDFSPPTCVGHVGSFLHSGINIVFWRPYFWETEWNLIQIEVFKFNLIFFWGDFKFVDIGFPFYFDNSYVVTDFEKYIFLFTLLRSTVNLTKK